MNTGKRFLYFTLMLICLSGSAAFAEEGDILWHRPVGDSVEGTPAVDTEGKVYVSGGSAVYSYAPDGTHRWTTEVGEQAGEFNSPALSPDEKVVYGGGVNFVYALDTATGKVKWKNTDFEVGFHSVPAISAGGARLYFGVGAERDEGDSFYCIDTTAGNVLWEYVMEHPARGFRGHLGGAIVGPDGTVYVATQHGWLLSLTDNGKSYMENWAYDVGAEMRMPPSMDADGYLYVGSSAAGGYVHKVDSRTGKSAGGNWPVRTTAGEVFAHIAVGADRTLYVNSEDRRLWAFNPDGTVKWNNLRFEVWGSDPLIREDGRIIVGAQLDGAARVACIRDDGAKAVIEWTSDPIANTFHLNETNVNIAPDGTLYIASGQPENALGESAEVYAIQGNGQGLSTTAQWPKYMGNIQNDGIVRRPRANRNNKNAGGTHERSDLRQLRRLAGSGRWLEYAGNPVLIPGEKGAAASAEAWDGRAIGSMSVLKVGSTFHMYYEGWGRGTIQIGHAVSEDGVHWTKDPENPILPRSEEGWDSGGRWDPFVLYEDGAFKMWYGATPRGNAKGNFHWGHAVSQDGTHFEKKGIISDEVPFAAFEDDHVFHDEETNRYYMYYWDREKEPKGLCRVLSVNETDFDFTKAEPVLIEGLSDTPMHKFTQVFKENGTWYMYYAEFKRPRCHDCATGYATSNDGLNWTVQNGNLLYAQDAEVVKADENLYLMYYGPNGFFDGKGCDIRLALYRGDLDDLATTRQTEISLLNGKGLGKTSARPEYIGDTQNNGNAGPLARDGTILWSCKIRGIVLKGGLALGPDNTVYAGTTEGCIYAVNPDGTVKWEMDLNPKEVRPEDMPPQLKEVPSGIDVRDIPDSIVIPDSALEEDNFSHASPTLTPDGTRLYVAGHTSGKIYCIDTAKGSAIWALNVREIPEVKNDPLHYGGGLVSSPAIGADGTIYIGSGDWWGDQWVEALRMGFDFRNVVKRRWSDRRLYAVNPDGTLKWTFLIEETDTHRTSIFGCPAIGADGTIYFGAFNGIFYALRDEGDKPKELWRHEVKWEPLSTFTTKYQEFWGSAAIAADGTIYVGNNDHHVYAFNPDGGIKWKFKTGNEVYQSVTIGGEGTVYIASEDRNLYALDPDDGAKKWSYRPEVGGIPFTASVTEDETVIFGLSGPNEVIALDGNTGDMKWQCTLDERRSDGTCTDPVIGPDGTIYMFGMNAIHAIKGSSPLSSKSAWPKVNRDNRNTGRAY